MKFGKQLGLEGIELRKYSDEKDQQRRHNEKDKEDRAIEDRRLERECNKESEMARIKVQPQNM